MKSPARAVLLRNFIHDRLYHPQSGYFCKPDLQVGELKQPIDFKKLVGYSDYIQELIKKYPANAWLTPSEIFKPFYGMALGNYLGQAFQKIKKQNRAKQLRVIEVGAGTGSAASGILEYFKTFEPRIYHQMRYTVVEISPQLCLKCEEKLGRVHHDMLQDKRLRVVNQDIVNYKDDKHNFILFFEVLDNMGHDKVVYDPIAKEYNKQAIVDLETNAQQLVELTDPHIQKCLQAYKAMERVSGNQQARFRTLLNKILGRDQKDDLFLPTYFLIALEKIKKKFPDFDLVISDFDALPSKIKGINAPIVSHKGQLPHQKIDYDTYLVNRGDADIFFPTSFPLLNQIYRSVTSKEGHVVKTHEFMKEFSTQNWATTTSGYNPIKEDFANTSFFVSKI